MVRGEQENLGAVREDWCVGLEVLSSMGYHLMEAAMGEITRRWSFVTKSGTPFELAIREPSMIGDDSIANKTWGSSFVLAHMLVELASRSFTRLLAGEQATSGCRVLELGSGTGLLG